MPDEARDAGRGMGLTDRQLLWRVELPLALPAIMAGLRIAATTTVGLAALATFAGAGGLGDQMASQKEFISNIAVGGALCVLMAVGLDAILLLAQRAAHPLDAREDGMTLAFLGGLGDALQFIVTKQRGPRRRAGRRHPAAAAAARAPAHHVRPRWRDRHRDRAAASGLWLGHSKRGSFLVVSVTNAGRAVPSIGVVFLFFAALGAGFFNITLALVLLAIPPILLNAYTGVRGVDPEAVDAARGMGLTGAQILRQVELPLALPLVFGGVKTSTVNVIATATLGPAAGVVTLGDPIINPSSYGDAGRLGAAIVVAALAIAAEVGLSRGAAQAHAGGAQAQRAGGVPAPAALHFQEEDRTHIMSRRRFIPALAAVLALALGVAACGSDNNSGASRSCVATSPTSPREPAAIKHNDANAKTTLTVGLEELHRAEGARRDLRPGLPGRRLHGQEGAQPRRREDGAEGGQDRPDLRLPGVHRHRAAVVPEGPGQGHPDRREPGLRAGQVGPGQAGHRGLPADARSPRPTRSGCSRRRPTSSG